MALHVRAGGKARDPHRAGVQPAQRGIAGEDVQLVARREVRVQEVVGVHGLRRPHDAQLVPQDLGVRHLRGIAQHDRARAGEAKAAQHRQGLLDAGGGVQQVPDRQVGRQAGPPVAAEHEVEAHGEPVAVHAEVAEQPGEAEHERAPRGPGGRDAQHGDLVVQVAVEVDGLGEHGVGARAGIGRAVAPGGHLGVSHDLAAQLQQRRLVVADARAVGQAADLLAQLRGLRGDRRAIGGDSGAQVPHRHGPGHEMAETAGRVGHEGPQRRGEGRAVPPADGVGVACGVDERDRGHPGAPARRTFGWASSCRFTSGHSPRSTL